MQDRTVMRSEFESNNEIVCSEYSASNSELDTFVCSDNALVIKNSAFVINCSASEQGLVSDL